MAATPLITFKAGQCTPTSATKIRPDPTPGYLYLYTEDDLPHLCWRPRTAAATTPTLDLLMIPGDGSFQPLVKNPGAETVESPTSGRVFVLSFQSSSQKHYFWLQSRAQGGALGVFSERDQRLGQIVDALLQGEEVDVEEEIEEMRRGGGGGGGRDDGGDNDAMDVDEQGHGLSRQGSGGAGPDATGGDARDEGEASREGGANGGRAATTSSTAPQDPSALVQNFLKSLSSNNTQQQQQRPPAPDADLPYTTLPDLLTPSTTLTFLNTASPDLLNTLTAHLPPSLLPSNPTPIQQREILARALRSPQFTQALASLTTALRDGGLPIIGEALDLRMAGGGRVKGGVMPLGGGRAVEGFVEGVKGRVEEDEKKEKEAKRQGQ